MSESVDGFEARDSPRSSSLVERNNHNINNNRNHDNNNNNNYRNDDDVPDETTGLLASTTLQRHHHSNNSPAAINNSQTASSSATNRRSTYDDNNSANKRQELSVSPINVNHHTKQSADHHHHISNTKNELFICCRSQIFKRNCKIICFVAFFLLVTAFGFIGVLGGNWIATMAMESEMVLTSFRTQLFKTWQNEANMDINVYRRYYFFNLTNPREVYFDRVAPDFRVVGPFVFKTVRDRPMWSIYWDTQDDVNFRYHDYQFWNEELSKDEIDGRQLSQLDNITSINMALFTATYRIGKIPNDMEVHVTPDVVFNKQAVCLLVDIERLAAEHRALGPKGIFTQRSVKEWLFGFTDPTLEMLHDGSKIIDYHVPVEFKLQFNDSVPAPGKIDFRHGQVCPLANFDDGCNNSMNADSSVTSGRKWDENGVSSPVTDIKHVGTLQKWAGNEKLWWFGEDGDCQRLRGTEGLFVGTNVGKADTPEIYVDALYRSIKLGFVRDSSVEGIETYRFGVNPDEIEIGPNSGCYDQFYHGALLNLSGIAFAEGFVTAKYFYPMKPDQKFLPGHAPYRGVSGAPTDEIEMLNFTITDKLNPRPTHIQQILKTQASDEAFSSHLDVHPLTGSTLSARSLLQINTVLKPIDIDGCAGSFSDMMPQERVSGDDNTTTYTSYFPQTGFPVLLIDRVADAPQPIISFLNSHLVAPLKALKIVGYCCLATSFLMVAAVVIWLTKP